MTDENTAFQSDLERAYDVQEQDAIDRLNKSELVFYVCLLLDIDTPAEHPSEYTGQVGREILREIAYSVSDVEPEESDE